MADKDVLGFRRCDEDLDSICVGSPSRLQIKIFCNLASDPPAVLTARANKALSLAKYLAGESRLIDIKPGKPIIVSNNRELTREEIAERIIEGKAPEDL